MVLHCGGREPDFEHDKGWKHVRDALVAELRDALAEEPQEPESTRVAWLEKQLAEKDKEINYLRSLFDLSQAPAKRLLEAAKRMIRDVNAFLFAGSNRENTEKARDLLQAAMAEFEQGEGT